MAVHIGVPKLNVVELKLGLNPYKLIRTYRYDDTLSFGQRTSGESTCAADGHCSSQPRTT